MSIPKRLYWVVIIPQKPFVFFNPAKNDYDGMLIDLLLEIKRRLKFDFKIYVQRELQYGFMDERGNWNGMMRDLIEKKADIALGALSLMSERMRVVDFTDPFYPPTGISVLMQKPPVTTAFYRFITVLELDVWLCIIGAYLFTSFLIWMFDAWSPYSYRNSKEKYKDDPEKRVFGVKESLWFCLTSLTPQGGGEAPKNLSGRLVAATWWLFGFIIVASYTANLAAFLTLSKFEKTVETFEDLVTQYKYTYTVVDNSSTYKYFERMHDIEHKCYEIWKDMTLNDSLSPYERAKLAVWEYPLSDRYIKIFAAITHHGMARNLSQGLEKLSEPNSRFTLIAESTEVKYQVMTDCRFKEIGPEFSKKPYAIALQKHSPLTKEFNRVMQDLSEENFMKAVTEKWWKYNPNKKICYDVDESVSGIAFHNIGGIFVMIGVGIVSAVVTLICEFFYFNYFREKFERIYKQNMKKLKAFVSRKSKAKRFSVKT